MLQLMSLARKLGQILDWGFGIADCGMWISNFGMWISDFGLRILASEESGVRSQNSEEKQLELSSFQLLATGFSDCRLQIWDVGLGIADCGFRNVDFRRQGVRRQDAEGSRCKVPGEMLNKTQP